MANDSAITELRGRDLDLAIGQRLGFHWVWAKAADGKTSKAIFAKPGEFEHGEGPELIDYSREPPTDESERFFGWDDDLPYYHADLNAAWGLPCSRDIDSWSFAEICDEVKVCVAIGVIDQWGWPVTITHCLSVQVDSGNYPMAYATARCLLWLLVGQKANDD